MTRLNIAALAPEGFNGLLAVETYLAGSGLDPKLKSLVKHRVSQLNGCAFCLHMHREESLKLGDTDTRLNMLNAWHESNMFNEREKAALLWAESLTFVATDHVPDATYAIVKAQFSDKELADLTLAVATINAWNRLSVSMRKVHPHDKAA